MTDTMELSADQQKARKLIVDWAHSVGDPTFYLGGYAGTGKTTTAKHVINDLRAMSLNTAVMAPTGKAAEVLRHKGLPATTIHKAIYSPVHSESSKAAELAERIKNIEEILAHNNLEEAVDICQSNNVDELFKEKEHLVREYNILIHKQEENRRFELSSELDLHAIDVIVIDEASMVGQQMYDDLVSLGKRILFIGDPGQLPPVDKYGNETEPPCGDPTYVLTQIHRQAENNPLIRMATEVRLNGNLPFGYWGDSCHIPWKEYNSDMLLSHDQIIVAKHRTRQQINIRCRQKLDRQKSVFPVKGDKLICLKNNYDLDLCNGSICYANSPFQVESRDHGSIDVIKDVDKLHIRDVDVYFGPFMEYTAQSYQKLSFNQRRNFNEFDFGYAITCHKSQGSEWPSVLVIDDGIGFMKDKAPNWMYTAITRAKDRVTIVKM